MGDAEKPAALKRVIDEAGSDAKVVVFCNMKKDCERLLTDQRRLGRGTYAYLAMHGPSCASGCERARAVQGVLAGWLTSSPCASRLALSSLPLAPPQVCHPR